MLKKYFLLFLSQLKHMCCLISLWKLSYIVLIIQEQEVQKNSIYLGSHDWSLCGNAVRIWLPLHAPLFIVYVCCVRYSDRSLCIPLQSGLNPFCLAWRTLFLLLLPLGTLLSACCEPSHHSLLHLLDWLWGELTLFLPVVRIAYCRVG